MTATIFEITETQFSEAFEYYNIRNIVEGEIISDLPVPEYTQEKIFNFVRQLEHPTLVKEQYKPFTIGNTKVGFLTGIIDGEAHLTTVQFNGFGFIQMSAEKQKDFIIALKNLAEQYSIDETDVNDK